MIYKKNDLDNYSHSISTTEKEQCEHAIEMVKDALVDYGYIVYNKKQNYSNDGYAFYYELKEFYNNLKVTVLIQGSYANNTNIKRYSDVDVSVIYNPGTPVLLDRSFYDFKNKIYNALCKKFGSSVVRKNKSINVKGNYYRKSIDVVPAYSIGNDLKDGIQFLADDGQIILNYPIKQINNENTKNSQTRYMFKKYVRIFKNIKEDMVESHIQSAIDIGSFQVESLLWNLDNSEFTNHYSLGWGVKGIINTLKIYKFLLDSFYESNGVKKLCTNSDIKLSLMRFIDDLSRFVIYKEEK